MHDASNQQVVVSESRMSFDSWESLFVMLGLGGRFCFRKLGGQLCSLDFFRCVPQ